MSKFLSSITCSVLLAGYASAAPASRPFNVPVVTNVDDALAPAPTLPYATDNNNNVLWAIGAAPADPQPIRNTLGATILGPQNVQIDQQNPDLLAPPTTDAGTVYVFPLNLCMFSMLIVYTQREREVADELEPQPIANWWLGASAEW